MSYDDRQKAWEDASDQCKRMMIAQDVLAQLDAKKVSPTRGLWIDFPGRRHTVNAAEFLEREGSDCQACAVGSAMLSACALNGDTISRGTTPKEALQTVAEYFGDKQTALMEIAFEGRVEDYTPFFGGSFKLEHEDVLQALDMYDKNRYEPEARLREIMQNVLDNCGTFDPSNRKEGCHE